jgi:hypothetical protein
MVADTPTFAGWAAPPAEVIAVNIVPSPTAIQRIGIDHPNSANPTSPGFPRRKIDISADH